MLYLEQPIPPVRDDDHARPPSAMRADPINLDPPPPAGGRPAEPPAGAPPLTSLEGSETTGGPVPWQSRPQRRIHARHTKIREAVFWAFEGSTEEALRKRATRIRQCCCHPEVRVAESGEVSMFCPRCRDRLCPLCSNRRSVEARERVGEACRRMDAPKHLVLTAPHVDAPLGEHLRALRDALRRLRASVPWKAKVRGGVYAFEITRNQRTGRWHPHVHILIDAGFWPQREICTAWGRALRAVPTWADCEEADRPIVHVSAVHSRAQVARYISKYVTKPAELAGWTPAEICEYASAIAGARMLHTFGSLHGAKLDPPDPNPNPAGSEHACWFAWLDGAAVMGDVFAQWAMALLQRVCPAVVPWSGYVPPPPDTERAAGIEDPHAALRLAIEDARRGKAAETRNEMTSEAAGNKRAAFSSQNEFHFFENEI